MNKQLHARGIRRLWLIQFGVVFFVTLLCALFYGVKVANSVVLGGLVCLIPNMYFASNLFKYRGAQAAKQIVSSFYKGEALKIVMSMFLFTIVFVLCRINPIAFFASYSVVLITHWFTPWIIVNKQK